ncbi:MAG: NAD-binding protein, partial [Casimicrobiaceae bacterium]
GRRIAAGRQARGIPYGVVEQNREIVEDLRRNGVAATWGDAGDSFVLVQSHIARAAMLVAATTDPVSVRQMIDTARRLNPGIEIVLRTHSEDEARHLRNQRLGTVFFGEEELAKGMAHHILSRYAPGAHAARI